MVTGVNTNPLVPSEDMTTIVTGNHAPKKCAASGSVSTAYWERAIRNVGQLKAEIEDLRKVSQQMSCYISAVFKIISYT